MHRVSSQKLLDEHLDKMQIAIGKDLADLKGEIKALSARLDTIQQQYSWKIGWLGTIFTFCGAALAVYPLLKQYSLSDEWIIGGLGIGGLLLVLVSMFRK